MLTSFFRLITGAVEANPKDGRRGDGRSDWSHVRVCVMCREETGHQEFMTQICLSCGSKMPRLPRSAATRSIYYHGKWRKQLRDQGQDFMREDGDWVMFDTPKGNSPDT